MSFLFSFLVFVVFCFPMFYSPVSMVGILLFMSLMFVSLLSFFSSFWYSYILFLVYVGGLLVLLIYICLASSNFPLMLNPEVFIVVFFISLVSSSLGDWSEPMKFLGQSNWVSGEMLAEGGNLSIFIFLVVMLLMMLLVVVRVSGTGFSIIVNDKS
nr:NADH dehydrogenase subunit 6 [Phestilla sp. CUS-2023]